METAVTERMAGYNSIHRFRVSDIDELAEEVTTEVVADPNEYVLIIDPRALDRECLSKSLTSYNPSLNVFTAGSMEEWRAKGTVAEPSAVILILGSHTLGEAGISERISDLCASLKTCPVILIAESDDLHHVLKAVECGVRGYIPSSVGINVAAEAISLARAGGVFIPASSILSMKEFINSMAQGNRCFTDLFTPREIQISEALRRGKANKIIAYEMELCESTVKVHIRNIMKKLHASNRTEVAFKLRGLMK